MNRQLSLLLLICVLVLPSCKHNLGNLFGPKSDPTTEFNYGAGSRVIQVKMNMTLIPKGQTEGQKVPVSSFNVAYSTKKVGSRIAWDVVLDNLNLFGVAQDPSPFYSVTFTSNSKGQDRADMVKRETKVADTLNMGKAFLSGINLPDGGYLPGDLSILVPVEAMKSEGVEIVFPEEFPKYVFNGTTDVDGKECYSFSFKSDVTVKQNGIEMPSVISVSAAHTKNMLPVYERSEIIMNDPATNMTIKLEGTAEEIVVDPKAALANQPATDSVDDLKAKLEAAPIIPVSEPIAFRYEAAACQLKTRTVLKTGKKKGALIPIPMLDCQVSVAVSDSAERIAWDVDMSELSFMGEDLSSAGDVSFAFTTNRQGDDIQGFTDKSSLGILSVKDIQNDYTLPKGMYKSGDVCMPLRMGEIDSSLEYVFPDDSGFVFQGMKEVDSLKVAVLTANVEKFTIRHKKTGAESAGQLKVVRYYDYETMLPLWYNGTVEMEDGKGGIIAVTGEMIRVDS